MVGKSHKGGLVTLAERKSSYVLAGPVRSRHAAGVADVATRLLKRVIAKMRIAVVASPGILTSLTTLPCPEPQKSLMMTGESIEQKDKTDYWNSLRLPVVSWDMNRFVSFVWRLARAKINPRDFL